MSISEESAAYRAARNQLLKAEAGLRAETERVAALRRALPDGPAPKRDYRFTDAENEASLSLSDLFGEKRSLFFYSFMFAPALGQGVCPMCVAMLDSLDGAAPHIADQVALAVGARATPAEIAALRAERGWRNLRFVTVDERFNADYRAETPGGGQLPIAHVWRMSADGPRYFWGSELFHHDDPDWAHHPRHVDAIWPLWNVLDLTPDGRGENWFPKLGY